MMRNCKYGLISVALGLSVAACGANSDPAPTAVVIDVTPESIDPADDTADDIIIVIEYTDGDADLGGGLANIHDCRADGLVTALMIPPIASQQAIDDGVPIEGALELALNDIGDVAADSAPPAACADLGVTEMAAGEVVFCVTLTDLAGNSGAGDCTPSISLVGG